VQELALAMALKPSKKFNSGSSGLSLTEKASTTKVKTSEGKASSTSACVIGASKALKVLDLFGSGSSAFDGEAVAPTPRRKRLQKSHPLKTVRRSSGAPATKRTSAWRCALFLSHSCYI
jgi:hypothetical protein